MKRAAILSFAILALLVLAGCNPARQVLAYSEGRGVEAADIRRAQNDLQARATMALVCDISIGAARRELTLEGIRFAFRACGYSEEMIEAILGLHGELVRLEATE